MKTKPYWTNRKKTVTLYHGDALAILPTLAAGTIDLVIADPPYFLSNGGSTCRGGKRTSVDKGQWDKSKGLIADYAFQRRWLADCRRLLAPNGSLWVSGTSHVIYMLGMALQLEGYKIVNDIVWQKPNPPPNFGCRCFTHSAEHFIWARRDANSRHYFDYAKMRKDNGGKQMKSVWTMPTARRSEREYLRHPTQKPEALIRRIVEACSPPGATVLDPFHGSGTTGVVAIGRNYVGIESCNEYVEASKRRIAASRQPTRKQG